MKKWLTYLLLALLAALLLNYIIHIKNMLAFWLYFGVMSVSTLINKWYTGQANQGRFLPFIAHIFYISTLGLLLWYPLSLIIAYFN
ncbi:MAG: hypothetical protein AB8G22_20060 [Saprospiraceae bacterium]